MAVLQSNVPSPDPSSLTTEQLYRALSAEREIISARLGGIDRVIVAIETRLSHLSAERKDEIGHLQALHDEKFAGIQKQFQERDVRTKDSETSSTTNIASALTAQKEATGSQYDALVTAINKSEAQTNKLIDSIALLITTNAKTTDDKIVSNAKAMDDKISVINARLDRGDGGDKANSSSTTITIAIAAVVVSAVIGMFTILNNHNSQISSQPTIVSPAVIPVAPR